MKHQYFLLALIVSCCAFLLGWTSFANLRESTDQKREIELRVRPSKEAYIKGEKVSLIFSLRNNSDEDRTIQNDFFVDVGFIAVYISKDGEHFRKYLNPTWGRIDTARGRITIKPHTSIETSAEILWNNKPDVSHLNGIAASRVTQDKILSDYAFPVAGSYLVKIEFSGLFDLQAHRYKIESEPIQIIIKEPDGEDLEVWQKIKDRGDIAYFIQEGRFRTIKREEEQRLKYEAELIVNQYPTSLIAKQIAQSLDKFRAFDEKRRRFEKRVLQSTN